MDEPRPLTGTEFARHENDVTKGGALIADLLVPEDSVLRAKGGSFKIYDSLATDDQVKSTFQQRRGAVTSCETDVQPASESGPDKSAADFIREQIDVLAWDDITDKHLWGVFYGFSVAEILYENDGRNIVMSDIRVRNRRRFRYGPDGGLRLMTPGDLKGEPMDERYFWHYRSGATHSDDPYGLGLAHYLYWPVFFKRTDMKYWLQFLEKFGTPQTIGKLPRGQFLDTSYQSKVLDSLEKLRQDAVSVVPDDLAIEVLEATKGTADYDKFDSKMDMRVAKIVLSQTMTTEAVGGQYKGTVHKEVRDEVIQADARLINESFDDQVVKRLVNWNFPNANPPKVHRKTEPEEDLNQRAERDGKIYRLGYKPTPEYINKTYGDGWEPRSNDTPPQLQGRQFDAGSVQDFSELVGTVDQQKAMHRSDQEKIKRAAMQFAENAPQAVGDRVRQLLQWLDESGDLVSFRERLIAAIEADEPPVQTVEALRQPAATSRMLGDFRAQRDDATTTGAGQ